MKKTIKFGMLLIACMVTTNLFAQTTYYIAGNGNGETRGTWCEGKNWNAEGTVLTNDEITFENLPAEWYEFKITEGSWNPTYGYSEVDKSVSKSMYKTYGDGNNICFRLQAPADVTVKMVDGKVVLLIGRELIVTGNGNNGLWLGGAEHNWKDKDDDNKLDANLSRTYYNLQDGNYEFKIKENLAGKWHDDCTWGFSHFDAENSTSCTDESGNIKFTLARPGDVTIALVNNQIRVNANAVYFITGNGSNERGTWCNQLSWNVKDADSRLDPSTLSKTYTALPAGNYEFKISNGAWQSGGGTIWNYDDVDAETSSPGYESKDGNNKNVGFELVEETDVTITFNPATGKITLVSSRGYFGATDPTAIDNVTLKNNGKYYDILGREVTNPQKGNLYIHNGKKVLF